MSKVMQLVTSYKRHIEVPWKSNISPDERVIFCVYNEQQELHLRAQVDEFELATKQAGSNWKLVDITDIVALWLSREEYREELFRQPELVNDLLPDELLNVIEEQFTSAIKGIEQPENTVVALLGVGSLFGFLKVKDVVDRLAPLVKGRFLIFFPGVYENKNYRLLNAYDGWNYLAVPITADSNF